MGKSDDKKSSELKPKPEKTYQERPIREEDWKDDEEDNEKEKSEKPAGGRHWGQPSFTGRGKDQGKNRKNDWQNKATCPPPIPAQQANQNVPDRSNYTPL